MFLSRLLPYGCLFAVATSQDPSAIIVLTGASGQQSPSPTGNYLSYASTITLSSTSISAITTSALVSTITSPSTTRTTTLGSTTLFGIGTSIFTSNGTESGSTSTSKNSQTFLTGKPRSTITANGTMNGTASSTADAPTATNTTPCNNYPEFCSRKYGNITEVSAHNSPFVKPGNAASNQALDVTTQLNDGIRLLQGQMHFVNSTPHFCHSSCEIFDAGPITEYLGKVYDWVSSHPYDVVTLLLGNGAYNAVTTYQPFIEETGLQDLAYVPPKIPMGIDDWPTLASMILSGKRIVIFMDYEANQTAVPYILDQFSQMFETPFDPTDRSFPCTADRPPDLNEADAKNRLYLFNHNLNYDINLLGTSLLVPQIPLLNVTNGVSGTGALGTSTQGCVEKWNYPPKFLNVDYYNVGSFGDDNKNGSVFEVAAMFNNVTYNRECCGFAVSAAIGISELKGRTAWLAAGCAVGVSWLML
ncbi:hypothetical protein LZ554_007504 [Drepanopeziza brunnea f. sp. 'monogermtubi']|nr:hypothetical protein LZ554_007504 [Drepanopeziza brunnea f. sp. 'monogermtubi']